MSHYFTSHGRRWKNQKCTSNVKLDVPLYFICSAPLSFSGLFFNFFLQTFAAANPLFFSKKPSLGIGFYAPVVSPRLQILQKKRAQLILSLLAPAQAASYYFPLIQASGSLVAAATSLGRKSRSTPLAQLLTCHFMRRYLISLVKLRFELWVKGGIGLFSAVWRHLVTPVDEVYWNPITQLWVFDVRVLSSDFSSLLNSPSAEFWSDLAGWRIISSGSVSSSAWDFFKAFMARAVNPLRSQGGQWFYRYSFAWELIFFQPVCSFGVIRTRKMRRLPRRQTKRLVKQTQTRFWVW